MSLRPRGLPPGAALILAGGRARRLGGQLKPLVEVAGKRILDWQLQALEGLVPEVWISSGRRDAFPGHVVVEDLRPGEGPLAGVEAGLRRARERGVSGLLVVAGDMPCLTRPLLASLIAQTGAEGAVIAGDSAPPIVGVWPAALLDPLAALLSDNCRSHREAVARLGMATLDISAPASALIGVNTPEDRDRAEQILRK